VAHQLLTCTDIRNDEFGAKQSIAVQLRRNIGRHPIIAPRGVCERKIMILLKKRGIRFESQ
jgi:hypothetical protein